MWIVSSFWSRRNVWEDRVLLPDSAYYVGRLPKKAQATNGDGTYNLYFPAEFSNMSRKVLILRTAPADLNSVVEPSLPPDLSSTCPRSLVLAGGMADLDGDASPIPPLVYGQHAVPPDAPLLEMTTIVPKTPNVNGTVSFATSGDACLRTDDGLAPELHQNPSDWESLDPRVAHTRQLKHRDAVWLPGSVVLVLRWEPFVLGLPPNVPRTDVFAIQKGQAASLGIIMKAWDKDAPLLSKANVSALMVLSSEISNPRKPLYTQPLLLSLPLVEQTYLARCIAHLFTFCDNPNQQWRGLPPLAHDLPWAVAKLRVAMQEDDEEEAEVYDDRPLVRIVPECLRSRSLFDVHSTSYGPPVSSEDTTKALESFWKVLCTGGTFATLNGLTVVWICTSRQAAEAAAASDTATKLRSLGARLLLRTAGQENREEVAALLVQLQLEYRSLSWYDAASQNIKDNPVVPPAASYLPPGGTAIYLDKDLPRAVRDNYAQGATAAQIKVINQTNFESPDILVHYAGLRMHTHEGANWDSKLAAPVEPAPVTVPAVATEAAQARAAPAPSFVPEPAPAPVPSAEPRPMVEPGPVQARVRGTTPVAEPRRRRRYHDATTVIPPTPRAVPTSRRERLARARQEAERVPAGPAPSHALATAGDETEQRPKSARFAALLQQEREAHSGAPQESSLGLPRREESIDRVPLQRPSVEGTLSAEPLDERRRSPSVEVECPPDEHNARSKVRQAGPPDREEQGPPSPAAPPALTDAEFETQFRSARQAVVQQERSLEQAMGVLNRSSGRSASRAPRIRHAASQNEMDEDEVNMEAWTRLGEEAFAYPPGNYMTVVQFEPPSPHSVERAAANEGCYVNVKPFRKQFVATYTPEGDLITEGEDHHAPQLPVPEAVPVGLPRMEALEESRPRDPGAPLDPAALAQRGDLLDEGTDEEEAVEAFNARPLNRPAPSRGAGRAGPASRGRVPAPAPIPGPTPTTRRARPRAVLDESEDEEMESAVLRRVCAPARPGRAAATSSACGRGRGRGGAATPNQARLSWGGALLPPAQTGAQDGDSDDDGPAPSAGRHVPKRPRRV